MPQGTIFFSGIPVSLKRLIAQPGHSCSAEYRRDLRPPFIRKPCESGRRETATHLVSPNTPPGAASSSEKLIEIGSALNLAILVLNRLYPSILSLLPRVAMDCIGD